MLGSCIAEELLPFMHYVVHAKKLRALAENADLLAGQEYADYPTLSEKQLTDRLAEERTRAAALDDKTFKLTLSLSLGLTILSSTAAYVSSHLTVVAVSFAVSTIIGLSLLYTLIAGLLALSALRTLPSFGYGTRLLLEQKVPNATTLASHLARQEVMNLIRQIRNEAAYQALRNGLVLLFVALLLFAATLAYQASARPVAPPTTNDTTSPAAVTTGSSQSSVSSASAPPSNPSAASSSGPIASGPLRSSAAPVSSSSGT